MQIEDDGPSETFKDEESKVVGVPFQVVFNSISIRLFYSWQIQCNTPDDETDQPSKEEIFKNRLRKELVSRDGHG